MLSLIPEMIIVYSIRGDLRILFTEVCRFLNLPHNKVRKRLTKKVLVSYSWKSERLPSRYLGRNLIGETVRDVECRHDKIEYLYSL